jgi:hypothetical protein
MNSAELTGTAMTWQSNTTGQDLVLSNPTAGAFSISAGNAQSLFFTTTGAGGNFGILSTGYASIDAVGLGEMTGGTGVNITATTGNANLTATAGDVELTGTDVSITTTGTGVGEFIVRANTNVDIKTTTGNIELWANTTMLSKSGGTNTLEVDGSDKMVTTSSTTTLTNTNIALTGVTNITGNTTVTGTTTLDVNNTFNMMPTATIIQNVSATVPSGFLYCNGQAVSRTVTYARLFAAIGTTFGIGNGTTTFNVPNFLGAFLRGASTQTVGGIAYTAAAVGTAQQDSMLQAATNSSTLQGYFNIDAGGGGASRQVIARTRIATDPIDACSVIPGYPRQNTTEVRPFNHAVYYYIRY